MHTQNEKLAHLLDGLLVEAALCDFKNQPVPARQADAEEEPESSATEPEPNPSAVEQLIECLAFAANRPRSELADLFERSLHRCKLLSARRRKALPKPRHYGSCGRNSMSEETQLELVSKPLGEGDSPNLLRGQRILTVPAGFETAC